ncbi:uncharacterized protein LOC115874110 [Sitophilus oryzae]|uniref:Uncharacterized protein LOC115874110 n=1 Tax=Sitophilus oryzae TaxID=7048 RepID=A0A6J2X1F4_SITOR|nr:uncharacterized protein LOC115874110 [Sitophilus oryzae]
MSHTNFVTKVPRISIKTKRKRRKHKKMPSSNSETEDTNEMSEDNRNIETRRSSYYSLSSSGEASLKVLETYDEFLNLKDFDFTLRQQNLQENKEAIDSEINQSLFLLKQICADLDMCPLSVVRPEREYKLMSLLQTNQISFEASDKEPEVSVDIIRKDRTHFKLQGDCIDEEYPSIIPQFLTQSIAFRNAEYEKPSKTDNEESIKGIKSSHISHSCNTQTNDHHHYQYYYKNPSVNKIVQTNRKTKCQESQSPHAFYENKYTNTTITALYPSRERHTQMYEHITQNDLVCLEWIDKNLFRISMDPNTMIVDERLKDNSEVACKGTSLFERELSWEQHALCHPRQ